MNVTLAQLRAFCAVARVSSFGRAAQDLNLSQSALSLRIAQLESLLETRLFERSTRQISLTEPGALLLPRARRLLGDLDLTVRDVREAGQRRRRTKVTIAGVPSYTSGILPELLAQFRDGHEDADVEIVDVNAEQVYSYVRSGHAHFGITMPEPDHKEICYQTLFADRYRMICSSAHPLAGTGQVSWAELERAEFILMSPMTSVRRVLDASVPEQLERLNVRYEVWNLPTVFGLVQRGLGITVLPELAVPAVREGLCVRYLVDPPVMREIGLIQMRDRELPMGAKTLIDMIILSTRSISK